MIRQDLHMHTTWSTGDSSVVPEQRVTLLAEIRHAEIMGISDHFDYLTGDTFAAYRRELTRWGFRVGTEVNGHSWVEEAVTYPFEYYIYHCRDSKKDYAGVEGLLSSGRPVIIAHPFTLGTNIDKIPRECYIEINNRYIWRHDWKTLLRPYSKTRKFIVSSDAHQPNWLNQTVARHVVSTMNIREEILF